MRSERGTEATVLAGGNAQFDVIVDGAVAFSKRELGRFPEPGEVAALIGTGSA